MRTIHNSLIRPTLGVLLAFKRPRLRQIAKAMIMCSLKRSKRKDSFKPKAIEVFYTK